jgi:hypothetical protein
MIDMPLPDLIELNTKSNMQLQVLDNSNEAGATNVILRTPNELVESLSIVYPKVTLADCLTIETALLGTHGSERIRHNNKRYLIDGYDVTYNSGYAKLSLTLLQVS